MCVILHVKHLGTTAFLSQTKDLEEIRNKSIITRVKQYAAENQRHWDEYVQLLTYEYNTQAHKFTGTTTFILVLSQHSLEPATIDGSNAFTRKSSVEVELKAIEVSLQQRIAALREKVDARSQNEQKNTIGTWIRQSAAKQLLQSTNGSSLIGRLSLPTPTSQTVWPQPATTSCSSKQKFQKRSSKCTQKGSFSTRTKHETWFQSTEWAVY